MDWKRTCDVIPDGVQTMSKMPCRYVDGIYPKYLLSGSGAYVADLDQKKYIDWTGSLGANLLGHAHPDILDALSDRYASGNLFVLPHPLETKLAEMLRDRIPILEQMRFLKSGTEACMAAVKIARAYTGRSKIISIGYHGWSDIFACVTPHGNGCPESRTTEIIPCQYNDFDTIYEQFLGHKPRPGREAKAPKCEIAAVIMEPYIFDPPHRQYLEKIRNICDRFGALLIFDEIVTGFRTIGWTAASMLEVQPDLMCLGKAMANGLPISVVGGKREYMRTLTQDTFVSSTFGAELCAMAAAIKTIEILHDQHGITKIWDAGQRMSDLFNGLCQGLDGVRCVGYPCRTFFEFPTEIHRSLFWQECCKRGVLFGYATFSTLAHGQYEIDQTYAAMVAAFEVLRHYYDSPQAKLEGKAAEATLRLR